MKKATLLTMAVMLVAAPAMAVNELIVTELMYNSPDTDVEWIEIHNASGGPIDLTGWYVLDDNDTHEHMLLSGVMAADDVMLLVGDEALFNVQYPGVTNYFPVFFQTEGATWALGNGGDGVRIHDNTDALVFAMDYDDSDPWPEACDGDGPSLLLSNFDCVDFASPDCWTAGVEWGTPGVLDDPVGVEAATWGQMKGLYR